MRFDKDIDEITTYFFKVDEVEALVSRLGFQVIDIVVRHPYRDVEYGSRRAYFVLRKP